MSTGNYESVEHGLDEGATHTERLFYANSHREKIDYACNYYRREVSPGNRFNYHTSDTYVLLLPNDMVYYFFSDSNSHAWIEAAKEANKLRPICSEDEI